MQRRVLSVVAIAAIAGLALASPVAAQDDEVEPSETPTTTAAPTTIPTTTPTTTLLLSAPTTSIISEPPTTVPTRVLGAQETDELAATGVSAGFLAGTAAGLLFIGGGFLCASIRRQGADDQAISI